MAAAPSFMMILMILAGNGPNELLDLVPTEAYWKMEAVEVSAATMLAEIKAAPPAQADLPALIRDLSDTRFKTREAAQEKILSLGPEVIDKLRPLLKSSDAEVAARAQQIIEKLSGKAGHGDIHRLMAIRALGEMKSTEALGALKALADSKEPFVADYARRAVAAIEGKPPTRPAHPPGERMRDVWLLPAGCSLVAQQDIGPGTGPVDVKKALAAMGPMARDFQVDQVVQQLLQAMLPVVHKLGNVRADCLTLGVAGDVGGRNGFAVIIARGLYDRDRAAALIKAQMAGQTEPHVRSVAGIEVYQVERGLALLMPSNDRFVMVAGPTPEQLPVEAVVKALAAGKGDLESNKSLAALIGSVDKTGPIWAAVEMTQTYRDAHKIFAPLTSATLTSKTDTDGVQLTVQARGDDAEKVAASVAELNEALRKAIEEIKPISEQMPPLKEILAALQSVKVAQNGKDVQVTGRLRSGGGLGMAGVPVFVLGARVSTARAMEVPLRAEVPKAANQPATRPAPKAPPKKTVN